jgi:hypothetical protein
MVGIYHPRKLSTHHGLNTGKNSVQKILNIVTTKNCDLRKVAKKMKMAAQFESFSKAYNNVSLFLEIVKYASMVVKGASEVLQGYFM